MARLTPQEMLEDILEVCASSRVVEAYTLRTLDPDVLSLRVYLVDASFIEVFFNAATERTAFALVEGNRRVYGRDNAKVGWHTHPMHDPQAHHPSPPVSFQEFLAEIEALRFAA